MAIDKLRLQALLVKLQADASELKSIIDADTATPPPVDPPPVTPPPTTNPNLPAKVTGLKLVPKIAAADASWAASAKAVSYLVQTSLSGADDSFRAYTTTSKLALPITGLPANTNVAVRVIAQNSYGPAAPSDIVWVKTLGSTTPIPNPETPPPGPVPVPGPKDNWRGFADTDGAPPHAPVFEVFEPTDAAMNDAIAKVRQAGMGFIRVAPDRVLSWKPAKPFNLDGVHHLSIEGQNRFDWRGYDREPDYQPESGQVTLSAIFQLGSGSSHIKIEGCRLKWAHRLFALFGTPTNIWVINNTLGYPSDSHFDVGILNGDVNKKRYLTFARNRLEARKEPVSPLSDNRNICNSVLIGFGEPYNGEGNVYISFLNNDWEGVSQRTPKVRDARVHHSGNLIWNYIGGVGCANFARTPNKSNVPARALCSHNIYHSINRVRAYVLESGAQVKVDKSTEQYLGNIIPPSDNELVSNVDVQLTYAWNPTLVPNTVEGVRGYAGAENWNK